MFHVVVKCEQDRQASLVSRCPSCSSQLKVSRMTCPDCALVLEGDFATSRLGLLSQDLQQFIEVFMTARGNIREVEKVLGVSYPTVRKKLDEVLVALGKDATDLAIYSRSRDEILSKIEKGELSAREGAKLLREL